MVGTSGRYFLSLFMPVLNGDDSGRSGEQLDDENRDGSVLTLAIEYDWPDQ
jgi:hypothetical protein